MSSDQLKAHLEFFEELGVDGIRREPEWRGRSVVGTGSFRGPEGSAPLQDA
jgi:hypothetical protein